MRQIFNFQFSIFNSRRGFTLIELLVVISIIGILSALLYGVFSGVQMKARDSQRKADLRSVQHALEQYRADQGVYPAATAQNTVGSCGSPFSYTDSSGNTTTYMQKIPCDPSGFNSGNYIYLPASSFTYTLAACIENTNDSDTNIVSQPSWNASYFSNTCLSGKYYSLNNP